MEVGEQRVARLKQPHFLGLRLVDLDDQLGLAEHRRGVPDNRRALSRERLVGDRRSDPGIRLYNDAVADINKLTHSRGRDRHTVFVRLDLGRNPDDHALGPDRS